MEPEIRVHPTAALWAADFVRLASEARPVILGPFPQR